MPATTSNYPPFPELLALIRRFHAQGKPIFGICLGAQLIGAPSQDGLPLRPATKSATCRSRSAAEGAGDSLLAGLATEQRIMQMHEDSFDLPARAVLLMRNGACANQAFRLGRTTYGFQFHLEVTETDAPQLPARLLARPPAPLRRWRRSRGSRVLGRGRRALRLGRAFLSHRDRALARPRRRLPRRRGRTAAPARGLILLTSPRSGTASIAPELQQQGTLLVGLVVVREQIDERLVIVDRAAHSQGLEIIHTERLPQRCQREGGNPVLGRNASEVGSNPSERSTANSCHAFS